ncbi:hypothetical protein AX16_004116 [Volvariella volvacea WC 439]|nr:hypothetical protein AX16_004116 [Volvariella volvacea WC 439]
MTRTQLSTYSPKVAKKAFREELKQRNLTYRQGMEMRAQEEKEKTKRLYPIGTARRNPGRMDGVQWNGQSFVSPRQVNGDVDDLEHDEELERYLYKRDSSRAESKMPDYLPREEEASRHVISLWDIAKPAKPRGSNKDYEVVRGVRQVIALDDDNESFAFGSELDYVEDWDEDDWESLFNEVGDAPQVRRELYSNIARTRAGVVGEG